MNPVLALFISLFTTLLAIINPLEALPVHRDLNQGQPETEQRQIARQACIYALLLCFFFLVFGTLLLRVFDVPLSMVRVVGGVILTRVGFDLFNPRHRAGSCRRRWQCKCRLRSTCDADHVRPRGNRHIDQHGIDDQAVAGASVALLAASAAIVACMAVIYLFLVYAKPILGKIGIQALTRRRGLSDSSLPQWAWASSSMVRSSFSSRTGPSQRSWSEHSSPSGLTPPGEVNSHFWLKLRVAGWIRDVWS